MLLNILTHAYMVLGAVIAVLAVLALWIIGMYAIFLETMPLFRPTKHDQD